MRRLISILGVQVYAFALAHAQLFNGVRTDEAKYLLNIPYPHPPLARWLLGLTDGWTLQEPIMRMLFATLLVQAVWLVWDMSRGSQRAVRIALCGLWLLSGGVILQAGTVMMAPLTALFALVFLWMLSLPTERLPSPAILGLWWLAAIFSALQGVLLAPLVLGILLRRKASPIQIILYLGLPLFVLGLYALGNPLLLASLFLQAGKDASDTFTTRSLGLLHILLIAGTGLGTFFGVLGLFLERRWPVLITFILIALYVFVGRYDYYAILFVPFFVSGAAYVLRKLPNISLVFVPCMFIAALILLSFVPLLTSRSPAREMLKLAGPGQILIDGPAGHEWQYEATSSQELRRYTHDILDQADALVCIGRCTDPGLVWWRRLSPEETQNELSVRVPPKR